MLYEDGGGDAGVDADHNVLDALVYIGPWSNMAAQVALQCDQSGCRNYYFLIRFGSVRGHLLCSNTLILPPAWELNPHISKLLTNIQSVSWTVLALPFLGSFKFS